MKDSDIRPKPTTSEVRVFHEQSPLLFEQIVYVDQKMAGPYTSAAIRELNSRVPLPDMFSDVVSGITDIGNQMCLPSSVSMGVNYVSKERLIGTEPSDSVLGVAVGDIYALFAPYHRHHFESLGAHNLQNGWYLATQGLDLYHHTVVAFMRAIRGVNITPVIGIKSIADVRPLLSEQYCALAVSMRNSIIIDLTLPTFQEDLIVEKDDGLTYIVEKHGDEIQLRRPRPGSHVVLVTEVGQETVSFFDPYRPNTAKADTIKVEVPIEKFNNLILDSGQGILVSERKPVGLEIENQKCYVPHELVELAEEYIYGERQQ